MPVTEETKDMQEFTLSAAEFSFVYHYGRETSGVGRGPAIGWLAEHNSMLIPNSLRLLED